VLECPADAVGPGSLTLQPIFVRSSPRSAHSAAADWLVKPLDDVRDGPYGGIWSIPERAHVTINRLQNLLHLTVNKAVSKHEIC